MVKSVIDGVTTYYVGGIYELIVEGTDETEVKYYYAASRRIAMRTVTDTTNTLHWLISDHLSSTTIITDESGTIVSEMKYTAFGEIREMNGSSPTDYLYTGQRKEVEFVLSYYNSRWYDAYLNQFTQPDTIIPDPGNWDRYAYVNYNPIKYSDPSGHWYGGDFFDPYDPAGIESREEAEEWIVQASQAGISDGDIFQTVANQKAPMDDIESYSFHDFKNGEHIYHVNSISIGFEGSLNLLAMFAFEIGAIIDSDEIGIYLGTSVAASSSVGGELVGFIGVSNAPDVECANGWEGFGGGSVSMGPSLGYDIAFGSCDYNNQHISTSTHIFSAGGGH